MNIAMWALAGGVVGWIAFAYLKANEERGLMISIVIGVVGGFFGGNVLAPMLGAAPDAANNFSMFSMVVALGCAAACLAVGNLISNRYGV